MKTFTIAHRIVLMIATSVLALLLVGVVGLQVADTGSESIRRIDEDSLPRIQKLADMRQAFMETRLNVALLFINRDDAGIEATAGRLLANAGELEAMFKAYEKTLASDADTMLLAADVSNVKTYLELLNAEVLPAVRHGELDQARDLVVK
jgi:methyl-accepting chemotaxis protein